MSGDEAAERYGEETGTVYGAGYGTDDGTDYGTDYGYGTAYGTPADGYGAPADAVTDGAHADRSPLSPVNVPAVVLGILLVAVGSNLVLAQLVDTTLDWHWVVAGVLLISGVAVVLSVVAAALRSARRG